MLKPPNVIWNNEFNCSWVPYGHSQVHHSILVLLTSTATTTAMQVKSFEHWFRFIHTNYIYLYIYINTCTYQYFVFCITQRLTIHNIYIYIYIHTYIYIYVCVCVLHLKIAYINASSRYPIPSIWPFDPSRYSIRVPPKQIKLTCEGAGAGEPVGFAGKPTLFAVV